MSKSNWSRYTAVGLASIALLGVVFGFGIYSYWIGNLAGYNEAEAQGYQAEYAEYTDQRVARCFEGVVAPRECVEKAIRDNYEQQRSESDLQAQRDMGNWAFWLLLVSSAGLCVTAIGTAFLAWQVGLTVEAVKETAKASKAMDRQNELTANMQRPWLDFEIKISGIPKYSVPKAQSIQLVVELKIQNRSNFPAHKVLAGARGGYHGGGLAGFTDNGDRTWVRSFLREEHREKYGDVIFPNQEGECSVHAEILDPHGFSGNAANSMVSLKVGLRYQFDGGEGLTERTFFLFGVPSFVQSQIDGAKDSGIQILPYTADTEAT